MDLDAITIERARRGDRQASAALLRGLQDPWFRLCRSLLHSEEQARDATQETALRFLRDLHRFRGDSSISTWSMGIAINVAREMRRKQSAPPAATRGAAALRPARPPDEMAQSSEQIDMIRSTLSDLPERQREAIVLRFFEELSIEDTAAAMGCAIGTVKATVHQALRALRTRLKQLA